MFLRESERHNLPKCAPNLDSSLLSHGLEHTIRNGMVNKNHDIDKNSDFVINLLKDKNSLSEWQLIEKINRSSKK